MKKIVCLLLAITCVFCFASCGGEEVDPDQIFFDTVASSTPERIKTLTSYTVEGEEPLNGTFETAKNGDGFVFSYSYQRYAELKDASNPDITVEDGIASAEGRVYYENGRYSKDRETWFSESPAVMAGKIDLNLDKEALGSYVMNEEKTSLTATLTAEAAEAVLGIKLTGAGDVTVTVSTNGTYLTRVLVSYYTENAYVTINTSYS